MIGHTRIFGELSTLVKRIRADGVCVCAHTSRRQVFRFAYDAIHQDLLQECVSVTIKVIRDRRVGVSSTETLKPASLSHCAKAAQEMARHAPAQPDIAELPRHHRIQTREDFLPATAQTSPSMCVALIKRLFHLCKGLGVQLAGSLTIGEDELAVVNSSSVACYAASTIAGVKLVTMYRNLSGYASGVHRNLNRLNLEDLLQRALNQSLHRREPIRLPLGTYEVILEPEAVAELVGWLGDTAFGAKSVEEHKSFLAGRMGEQLMDPSLTIYDDGNDPLALRLPFDFEGTPKQKTLLIDRGRAVGIVYDTTYGARFGHPSTGHAMPADDVEGPLPMHLAMEPGTTPLSEMIRGCKRGLLIPRFHYVNGLLNPREALMTGLTREGTFLIEHGQLVKPVATMRFTQSLLEAFRQVVGVSQERRLIADPSQDLGCALMPALHLAGLRFTGGSDR